MGKLTKLITLDVSTNPELVSPPPETIRAGTAAGMVFLVVDDDDALNVLM